METKKPIDLEEDKKSIEKEPKKANQLREFFIGVGLKVKQFFEKLKIKEFFENLKLREFFIKAGQKVKQFFEKLKIKEFFKNLKLREFFEKVGKSAIFQKTKAFFEERKIEKLLRRIGESLKKLEIKKRLKDINLKAKIKAMSVKQIIISASGLVVLALSIALLLLFPVRYNRAIKLYQEGEDYSKAYTLFTRLNDYKDAPEYAEECRKELEYIEATALMDEEEYRQARVIFEELGVFKDSVSKVEFCNNALEYELAEWMFEAKNYSGAMAKYAELAEKNFKDSSTKEDLMSKYEALFESEALVYSESNLVDTTYNYLKTLYSDTDIADEVSPLYFDYAYDYARLLLHSVKIAEGVSILESLPEGYRQRDELLDIFTAYRNGNYDEYVELVKAYFESPKADLNAYFIYNAMAYSDYIAAQPAESAIQTFNAYRQLKYLCPKAYIQKFEDINTDIGLITNDNYQLIENCGSNPKGKILVIDHGVICFGLMDFMSEDLIPASLDEVEYIILAEDFDSRVGSYTSGTAAMRHGTEVKMVKCPSGARAKSFGKILGSSPPMSFWYYGSPPSEKFGSEPDGTRVDQLIENSVGKYIETLKTDGFNYVVENGTAVITKYTGKSDEVVIPDEIDGIPVTHIMGDAFAGKENIVSIKLPKGLLIIPDEIFSHFDKLETITLPNSVREIGANAFLGCTSLKSVNLNNGLRSIGSNAFAECGNLSTVSIPESVYVIGTGAFNNDTALESIMLPSTLETIPATCFLNCSNLSAIEVPVSCTEIGIAAFKGTGISNIRLPEGLVAIKDQAFMRTKVSEIRFPSSLAFIGSEAFRGCSDLKDIYLPKTVTHVTGMSFPDEWMNVYVLEYSCAYESMFVEKVEVSASKIKVIEGWNLGK